MAGGYDGTIRIDTSVDAKGVNKGTKSMANSLGSLLKSITSVGKALLGIFVGGTIIGAIRGIVGSFDLMKSSIGESLKPVTDAMTTLKGSFVNLIATALIPLVPYIVMAVNWLTNLVGIVTQVVAALFGMQKTVGGITKEIKKTGKEAKGALAAFDQINVLNINKPEDAQAESNVPTPGPIEVGQGMFDRVQELKKAFMDMWENVKKGASEAWDWFTEIWSPVGTWINDNIIKPFTNWATENPEKFFKLVIVIGLLVIGLYLLSGAITLATTVGAIFIGIWDLAALVIGFALTPLGLIIITLLLLVGTILYVIAHWEELKTTVYQLMFIIGSYIGSVILSIMAFFDKLKTTVSQLMFILGHYAGLAVASMKESFGKGLDWVKNKFISIFEDIKIFVKGVINSIIDMINGMIASITNGINFVLTGTNAIGGVMGAPALPPISAVQIPRLATGAVIPPNAQFAAILGDQRNGKNLEAPAAMFEEMLNRAAQNSGGGEITVHTPVYLDSEKIYDGIVKVKNRRGKNMVKGMNFNG